MRLIGDLDEIHHLIGIASGDLRAPDTGWEPI
jgi:hypothetical protein